MLLTRIVHALHAHVHVLVAVLEDGVVAVLHDERKRRICLGMVRVVVAAIALYITWCALHWTHMVLSQ